MEINTLVENFLAIGIVGAGLSVIVEFIKAKFGGLEKNKSKAIVIVGSLLLGGLVYVLAQTPYWINVAGVLGAASVVYGFVVKK